MKKKIVLAVLVSTCLFSAMLYLGEKIIATPEEGVCILRVEPSIIEPKVEGEIFTVNIVISNVTDCYMVLFSLFWDPGVIDLIEVTKGDFLEGTGIFTIFVADINRTVGYIKQAAYTRLGGVPGVDGNGTVATVEFVTLKPYVHVCTSSLNLTDMEEGHFLSRWLDSEENEYQFKSLIDGFFVIRVPEDYPTIGEAIDAAEPGATVTIATGTYNESLVINKTLTILGRKGSATEFVGGGSGVPFTLLPGASGSTVAGVVITNWEHGIRIVDASDCKIYDNVMSLNVESGIILEGGNAADNLIYSNIFQDNTIAINLTASSTSNIIYKNIISSSDIGLNLESDGNTIYANTISDNEVGIDVSNSNGNIIYHNNFIDNTAQVHAEISVNVWDNGYPSGGNYWSDHTKPDVESPFGIVDSPYVMDENDTDNYPLTSPYEYWSNPIEGDINKDTRVDWKDLFIFARAYGSSIGEPAYVPEADFDNSGKIDWRDLLVLAQNYGKVA